MNEKLIVWTLVADLLILIGAGHGVGPLAILELGVIINYKDFDERLIFSLKDSYDHLLLAAMLFSSIGQLLMLLTWSIKRRVIRNLSAIIGLPLMWSGVLYLSINCRSDGSSMMSVITAIAFIALSILLLAKFYLGHKETVQNVLKY